MLSNSDANRAAARPVRRSGAQQWWAALVAVWNQIGDANMGLVAAGVAFFGMLAVFPGLAAMIALFGLVADPDVILGQLELVESIVPAEVFALVEGQILTLLSTSGDTLGWAGIVSVLVATWSARSGVSAMMLGLNAIYGRRNRRSIRHYLVAMLLTVALMAVALIALSAVVIAPLVLKFVPLGGGTALLIDATRWAAALGVLLVGLAVLYRYGPNSVPDVARMQWVTPGAVVAVVLWAMASWGFSYYLGNFGNYNEVYGSIGAAIALLTWLYVTAFVVLLGAALNVQLAAERAADAHS